MSWRKVNEEKQFGAGDDILGSATIARDLVDPRVIVLAGSAVTTLQRCFPSIMLNWTVYSSKGKGSGVASEIAVSVEKLRAEEELWPTMRPTCRKERKKERKV